MQMKSAFSFKLLKTHWPLEICLPSCLCVALFLSNYRKSTGLAVNRARFATYHGSYHFYQLYDIYLSALQLIHKYNGQNTFFSQVCSIIISQFFSVKGDPEAPNKQLVSSRGSLGLLVSSCFFPPHPGFSSCDKVVTYTYRNSYRNPQRSFFLVSIDITVF